MRSTLERLALIAIVLLGAGVLLGTAQDGVLRIGSGTAIPVEFMVDGRSFMRLNTNGTFEGINGGQITGVFSSSEDVPYSGALFTTNGDKTWTVQSADLQTYTISVSGRLRIVTIDIINADIGAGSTGTNLLVALPFTSRKRLVVPSVLVDATTRQSGRCVLLAGQSSLQCTRHDQAVLTTGTANSGLHVQFIAETQ